MKSFQKVANLTSTCFEDYVKTNNTQFCLSRRSSFNGNSPLTLFCLSSWAQSLFEELLNKEKDPPDRSVI